MSSTHPKNEKKKRAKTVNSIRSIRWTWWNVSSLWCLFQSTLYMVPFQKCSLYSTLAKVLPHTHTSMRSRAKSILYSLYSLYTAFSKVRLFKSALHIVPLQKHSLSHTRACVRAPKVLSIWHLFKSALYIVPWQKHSFSHTRACARAHTHTHTLTHAYMHTAFNSSART